MQWGEEGPPPLLVKIAPDLSKEDLEDIAAVCLTSPSLLVIKKNYSFFTPKITIFSTSSEFTWNLVVPYLSLQVALALRLDGLVIQL